MAKQTILVTGAAGFIGAAVTERLLKDGYRVVGFDNFNDYYDVRLKEERVKRLRGMGGDFHFERVEMADKADVLRFFAETKPEMVVHLAAQAGVRYGLVNQQIYLESNLIGHFNILAACKAQTDAGSPIGHLLYASSSSVYGNQEKTPFSENDDVSRPVSLYAATKRADEMITHAWAHQFGLASTGLRFFTVYGPWGRPDMSPMLFATAIADGKAIPLFNDGDLWRDFTYVDDIVEAIVRLMPVVPTRETCGGTPHTVFNLGNQNPVQMREFVKTLAKVMGCEAKVDSREWPPTEVYQTFADTSRLKAAVGWAPSTKLEDGLARFAAWFAEWRKMSEAA